MELGWIVLQQTYGVMMMTGDRKSVRPGKVLRNPVLLASAAPAGANVAAFARLCGLDSGHAAALVCNSTILSIGTLAVMVMIASAVW
ncbi:MAG: hypothetical protein LUF34_07665 [Lachnospiraceae bacterium]|nr:hypothetical protein [Lachnospiraceae bacterium]